jgi:hypothetical protein
MPSTSWFRRWVRVALPVTLMTLAACGREVEDAPPTPDGGSDGSPQGCRSSNDCPGTLSGTTTFPAVCWGPISPARVCILAGSCPSDGGCPSGYVCSTGAGAQAEDGGPSCRPPCSSNDDCNYWEACQPDGKCQALSCEQCPSYLTCTKGACGPKTCKQDSDCPGGYCVDNSCFATLGTCGGACG